MSDSDKKLDTILGMVHELKPVVMDIREGQKAMDERMRAAEVRGAEHEVKLERAQEDLNGLGRKVRAIETRPATSAPPAPTDEAHGKWVALVEFLAALPAYWHILGAAVTGALAVFALIGRHHQ